MKKIFFILFFLMVAYRVEAATIMGSASHFTVILNQVRGNECCGVGNIDFFEKQLVELDNLEMIANFTLRFDVLQNQAYLDIIAKYPDVSYGALLEITPELAKKAGVNYKGNEETWYEAQNVFLIGYNREDRQKLIDTYMVLFKEKMGEYPEFSGAWMIDNWSLSYLKSQYKIKAHQITREQFGTDSYTLYGGPVHYPYWPSDNWAMIPQEKNLEMPLILRQTITDPVYNYGDKTNSYTSQPNDYMLRQDGLDYFKHLFGQAHQQNNAYTFALIGLENSMSEIVQEEYYQQLAWVDSWRNEHNLVVKIVDFEQWLREQDLEKMIVYGGQAQNEVGEQAWWINSNRYRVRLRLSAGVLALTDLRLYDEGFMDPYSENLAGSLGWWIAPFVLDYSRNFIGNEDFLSIRNDRLGDKVVSNNQSGEVVIASEVKNLNFKRVNESLNCYEGEKLLVSLEPEKLVFDNEHLLGTEYKMSDDWGFKKERHDLLPFINNSDLNLMRTEFGQALFPELKVGKLNVKKSYIHLNNRFAIAGRNPVRLAFFPKNEVGEPIFLAELPEIKLSSEVDQLDLIKQSGSDGMLFIDLHHKTVKKVKVTVIQGDFKKTMSVYFAPIAKLSGNIV